MGIDIRTVGIIGAGQMGSGIAHVCAMAGLDVRLNDRDPARIHNGLATVDGIDVVSGNSSKASFIRLDCGRKRSPPPGICSSG